MNIPPYWARARYKGKDHDGRGLTFDASAWSFTSMQEARDAAAARAKQIFERFTGGDHLKRYEYHDRPIREEILKQIGTDDPPAALITRNRYGALVLNCRNVMFVDVDFDRPPPSGILEGVLAAFSRKRRGERARAIRDAQTAKVYAWAERNPGRGFRLYRTREGLRLLFTDRLYEPRSDETAATLAALDADPLYVKLTHKQECFRARLTSKPWRCGTARPPVSYPWEDAQAEARYRKWETKYTQRDAGFKVCEFVQAFGPDAGQATIRAIVEAHDRATRINAQTELA